MSEDVEPRVGNNGFQVLAGMLRARIIDGKNVIGDQERIVNDLYNEIADPIARNNDRNFLVGR